MRPAELAHQGSGGGCGRRAVSQRGRRKGYGNAGSMESVEKQKQLFPSFHAPLEISPKARDSHIPTARRRPGWKSGKPQPGFPLSHAGRATTATVHYAQNQKPKQRDRPLRGLPSHLRITLYWKCHSKSKNLLPRASPTRYNKLSPGRGPLAGFEVTLYGRF
jgi:hypothetical protein